MPRPAAGPAETWGAEFDSGPSGSTGRAYATVPTGDGGQLVAGSLQFDVWLARLDAHGFPVWERRFGGPEYDYALDLERLPDGDIVLGCYSTSFGAGSVDFWVLRLDPQGAVRWQRTVGGSGQDRLASVAVRADGGVLAVGSTFSFGAGASDAWVVALAPDGAVDWQYTLGGAGFDGWQGAVELPGGDVVLCGNTTSFSDGDGDLWLVRMAPDGGVVWQRRVGDGRAYHTATHLARHAGGELLVTGYAGAAGDRDLLLLRLDPGGSLLWQRSIGDSTLDLLPRGLVAARPTVAPAGATAGSPPGGWLAAAYMAPAGGGDGEALLLAVRDDGTVDWSRAYGGREINTLYSPRSVAVRPGGLVLVGYSQTSFGSVNQWEDPFVLALDEGGGARACPVARVVTLPLADPDLLVGDTPAIAGASPARVTGTGAVPQAVTTFSGSPCASWLR